MNKLLPGFFMLLFLLGCQDEERPQPDPDTLQYDGPNLTSPFFPSGTTRVGVRFAEEELSEFGRKELIEVHALFYDLPTSTLLKIYDGRTRTGPENVLFEADLSQIVQENAWNEIILDPPIQLPEQALWITFEFNMGEATQVIGCDAGPMQRNATRIYGSSDLDWRIFSENVNWNIRGLVR